MLTGARTSAKKWCAYLANGEVVDGGRPCATREEKTSTMSSAMRTRPVQSPCAIWGTLRTPAGALRAPRGARRGCAGLHDHAAGNVRLRGLGLVGVRRLEHEEHAVRVEVLAALADAGDGRDRDVGI